MNILSRLRLRQIFLLFVCASVGLATYPNVLGALEPAIATAVAIGLIEEVVQLVRAHKATFQSAEFRFARRFAIAWRIMLATSLLATLAFNLLIARGFASYPERDQILTVEIAVYAMSLCVVITLLASVERWRSNSQGTSVSRRYLVLVSVLAVLMTLYMVVDGTTLDYLVHQAVAGIETEQDPRWRRPSVYIALADESFRTLWLALLAVVILVAPAFTVTRLRSKSPSQNSNWLRLGAIASLLLFPAAFCCWYYKYGLERLSPDIAEAGLALVTSDWLMGIWVGTIIVTAGAYKLARTENVEMMRQSSDDDNKDHFPLYESLPCLIALVCNSVYALGILIIQLLINNPVAAMRPLTFGLIFSMVCSPEVLFVLASAAASFQLCWYRWKGRNRHRPNDLYGLSLLTFGQAWIALALLLAVGIPTLRAFAFILWLGPVDLRPVFGLR